MATKRRDTALTEMAGEFLAAGQLLKRGLLASVTMGHAKAIDVLVHNEKTQKDFHVQVKTIRAKGSGWFMQSADPTHTYVFVTLNGESEHEEYFVVKGSTLCADLPRFFGLECDHASPKAFDGVDWNPVQEFKDNWRVFDEYSRSRGGCRGGWRGLRRPYGPKQPRFLI
jgi:hypothetical protein